MDIKHRINADFAQATAVVICMGYVVYRPTEAVFFTFGRNETATETDILVSAEYENETALSVLAENEIECNLLNL